MKIAAIGRTRPLIEAARRLADGGHQIAAVWTCRDEPFYDASVADFKDLAHELDAPFRDDLGINTNEGRGWLQDTGCDIGISVNWLTVIEKQTLSILPRGILNAHAGDLPRYRGNACPNWAILNGEQEITLTIHEMVEALDAGPIICKSRYPLSPGSYIGDIYRWLAEEIPMAFELAVNGLQNGSMKPTPQSTDPQEILRCYPRRPEDSRIDWTLPAPEVHRLVRASSKPFAGAFAYFNDAAVIVWRADVVEVTFDFMAIPGQVMFDIDGDPIIACGGRTAVRLTNVVYGIPGKGGDAKSDIIESLRNRLL